MDDQPIRFIKLLESKKIKYVDLDKIKIDSKKPDFIIYKNSEKLIIELKEISYNKKEIAQFNLLNTLFNLIKKLNFHYTVHIDLNDKFELNNNIIKAINKMLKKYKGYIDSNEINFQILIPENFNINEIVEYEMYTQSGEIINKTITYKIKNSEKIPFRFKNNNLHCFVKFNDNKANLLDLETYDLLEFANFILTVETVKSIKIKGTVGPSKAWWVGENLLKEKILYQIKEANRQFKDFKKNKKNFNNLETVLVISIKNMYLDSLIYDKESLYIILSEIFNKESFSAISCISFLTNEKIINSFINNNYSFDNDLRKNEIIELLES